jgi:hypothetical protein
MEAVETRVDTMEAIWALKFTAMEERMQLMDTIMMKNTISLSHIANKLNCAKD